MSINRKKNSKVILCMFLIFGIIIVGFVGCKSNNGSASNLASNVSAIITSDSSIVSETSTSINFTDSIYYQKINNLGKVFNDVDYNAVQSQILLKATGNTYYVSAQNNITFSYQNGKYTAKLPQEYLADFSAHWYGGYPNEIYVSPTKTAFVCEINNCLVIVYSNDMGKTWKQSKPIPPSQTQIKSIPCENVSYVAPTSVHELGNCVYFVNNNLGFLLVMGGDYRESQYGKLIFKTTDGGNTWNIVDPHLSTDNMGYWIDPNFNNPNAPQIIEVSKSMMNNIMFMNQNIGFLGGYHYSDNSQSICLYKTKDGGLTCVPVDLQIPNKYRGKYTYVMQPYINNGKWYLPVYLSTSSGTQSDSLIYYTSTDNGNTWTYESSMDKFASDFIKLN